MTGHYSRQGIVDEGLYDWTEMKPFLRALPPNATSDRENAATGLPVKIKHDWGDRYILEVWYMCFLCDRCDSLCLM